MKKSNYLIALLSLFLSVGLLTSCGGDKKEKEKEEAIDKLGKMELVIPDELKDNPVMVQYIKDMTTIIDEYAVLMDEMVEKMGDFKDKDFDKMKLGEQLKFTAIVGEVGMKSAPLLLKWAEYETQRTVYAEELTEEETAALETVWTRFEDRMNQIQDRHHDFFDDSAEAE